MLEKGAVLYSPVDFFYFYVYETEDIVQTTNNFSYSENNMLFQAIRNAKRDHTNLASWRVETYDEGSYLLCTYRTRNMEVGSCVRIESILPSTTLVGSIPQSKFFLINTEQDDFIPIQLQNSSAFTDSHERPISLEAEYNDLTQKQSNSIITAQISGLPLLFCIFVPQDTIWSIAINSMNRRTGFHLSAAGERF